MLEEGLLLDGSVMHRWSLGFKERPENPPEEEFEALEPGRLPLSARLIPVTCLHVIAVGKSHDTAPSTISCFIMASVLIWPFVNVKAIGIARLFVDANTWYYR